MKIGLFGGVLLGLCLTATGCVSIADPAGRVVVRNGHTRVSVAFSDRDRALVRDYYRTHRLPPGLAKRSRLPPGLRKHIRRHGRLPPGLEGRALPRALERDMRRLPNGYVRLRIGADVVILQTDTDTIVDVVHDVLH